MKPCTKRRLLPLAALLGAACTQAMADSAAIKINQVGFPPAAQKLAVVPAGKAAAFIVVDAHTGKPVLREKLGEPKPWDVSGETVRIADFTALKTPGRYRLRVAGLPDSAPFDIQGNVYRALNIGALKAYYYNRASTALLPQHAGIYARAAGHPDTEVLVHASAASAGRPEGTVISAPKGWYDAGDYNKYIVNSGISTYTLLAAWEHFPQYFKAQDSNLPESGNGMPDIVNEALWNLDWMLAMQDPGDGGVYHKLTDKDFDGMVMPDQPHATRYVVQKSTAAALDFAAVMAVASRVMAPFERQRPGLSARMRQAAEAAWGWAQAHPDQIYRQPADIVTGDYSDSKLADEFAWAAAELYITTGKDSYYQAMRPGRLPAGVPSWGNVGGLAWISLAHHLPRLTPAADKALITRRITSLADQLRDTWSQSPYRVPLKKTDFVWGSNAVLLNQAMVLLHAYRIGRNQQPGYLQAAQSALDYVLGRNATGYSFVTGFGAHPAMHPHHRPSEADGISAPVPGWLVGGPNPGQEDIKNCKSYPSALPALSYLDHVCSYASNEVAINWNAPLVYVSAALNSLQ
ncbi:cellulase [Duganella sp. FT92W]|uniref:Endoglucanase n=1 Tax=Pseudoduganella rivuli TaxID=2666085 RepID=A0A7X2IMQ9_9BURK|nr:glycoside hydrolase family 9 protein [Pseudoduganella rivuli]MRV72671.1 cellulase [Pseudoduganella rivuli]